MDVAPHPHIGLQTVTWLLEGEVAHDDSLGSAALLRPGGVNVMTSGDGIAHAEQTPRDNTGRLNGVQLWMALPEAGAAAPRIRARRRGASRGVAGRRGPRLRRVALRRATRPAALLPLVGADLQLHRGQTLTVPLDPAFEHAMLVLQGDAALDGQPLAADTLYYLGCARTRRNVTSRAGARVLLIGGPPFPETILMWWNFVARTPEEIAQAREDWESRHSASATSRPTGAPPGRAAADPHRAAQSPQLTRPGPLATSSCRSAWRCR